jgi:phospholipid/cholesterol/gamma-HCH transport system permease protein
MAVTEQIDALRALGADPVRKLVVPRVVAMSVAMPLLTILADLVGCAGGMLITVLEVGMGMRFALDQMIETVAISDVLHGLIKSLFFGSIIALVACWNGMKTYGGTEGVGKATTTTVVIVSVTILIADFLLTRGLMAIYA